MEYRILRDFFENTFIYFQFIYLFISFSVSLNKYYILRILIICITTENWYEAEC